MVRFQNESAETFVWWVCDRWMNRFLNPVDLRPACVTLLKTAQEAGSLHVLLIRAFMKQFHYKYCDDSTLFYEHCHFPRRPEESGTLSSLI